MEEPPAFAAIAAPCSHDPTCETLYQQARRGHLNGSMGIAQVEQAYRESLAATCTSVRVKAGEKLALLLLQSNRATEAGIILAELGYTFRIAQSILNERTTLLSPLLPACQSRARPYCCVFDNFLMESELHHLKDCFMDMDGDYWKSHKYEVEPPSPYFSYLVPLELSQQFGSFGSIIDRLFCLAVDQFPVTKNATIAEIWAHNRPHATGHQLHFDSDNEGCTEIVRNPIVSCVLYLSQDVGGPTVVTTQRLNSQSLASTAWVVPCNQEGRLVMFDGKLLHGVIPGSGSRPPTQRRVTLMVAFWKSIRARDTMGQAACQWPTNDASAWAQQLTKTLSLSDNNTQIRPPTPLAVAPIQVTTVYESVTDGMAWTKKQGFPDYEQIFQGV